MKTTLSIDHELQTADDEKVRRLKAQTESIKRMTPEQIEKQGKALEGVEQRATEPVKRIIAQMEEYLGNLSAMVAQRAQEKFTSGDPKEVRQVFVNYLIQAWYHTSYTPEFEATFGQKLKAYIDANKDKKSIDTGNKFVAVIEEDADDELGHELWALEDIKALGGPAEIDVMRDVYPETRALVRTQFDRLHRMNFIGFLGYSFYLEYWIGKYAPVQLALLKNFGVSEGTSFVYNHWVVDQGHAADNIELLNYLIDGEDEANEVLDNMAVINALYHRMLAHCFE